MSRNVLVIGRGKPYHITKDAASELVLHGWAIWKKPECRIKYIKSEYFRPEVRGLSCTVGQHLATVIEERREGNSAFRRETGWAWAAVKHIHPHRTKASKTRVGRGPHERMKVVNPGKDKKEAVV